MGKRGGSGEHGFGEHGQNRKEKGRKRWVGLGRGVVVALGPR
jgi:hypothetical protein